MSTHVIKRRAITTPSYRISSGLRCFGFFFITGVALPRSVIQGFRAKNPRSRQDCIQMHRSTICCQIQ